MSLRDVFGTDLALLHVPSVYDFRTSVIMHGPIADAVPSTNEFEMYPVGLTSIASYLSANHYNVRIINLAYLMLTRHQFDVEAYLARLQPKMFGIDLHRRLRTARRLDRGAVPATARRPARRSAAGPGGEPDLEGRQRALA